MSQAVEVVTGRDLRKGDKVVPLWIDLLDKDIACGEHWETVTDIISPTSSHYTAVTVDIHGRGIHYGGLWSRTFIRKLPSE